MSLFLPYCMQTLYKRGGTYQEPAQMPVLFVCHYSMLSLVSNCFQKTVGHFMKYLQSYKCMAKIYVCCCCLMGWSLWPDQGASATHRSAGGVCWCCRGLTGIAKDCCTTCGLVTIFHRQFCNSPQLLTNPYFLSISLMMPPQVTTTVLHLGPHTWSLISRLSCCPIAHPIYQSFITSLTVHVSLCFLF